MSIGPIRRQSHAGTGHVRGHAALTADFSFVDRVDVDLESIITSAPITAVVSPSPGPISISGGTYSIGGGNFTSAAGSVVNGATVRVRHTASASPGTAVNTVLTIDGVSDTFTSTTAQTSEEEEDAMKIVSQGALTLGATHTIELPAGYCLFNLHLVSPVSVVPSYVALAASVDGVTFLPAPGSENVYTIVGTDNAASAFPIAIDPELGATSGASGVVDSNTGDDTPFKSQYIDSALVGRLTHVQVRTFKNSDSTPTTFTGGGYVLTGLLDPVV